MAWARPEPLPEDRTITLPPGAALIYVSDGDKPTTITLDRADVALMDRRDRMVCRALLGYVVEHIDEADKY